MGVEHVSTVCHSHLTVRVHLLQTDRTTVFLLSFFLLLCFGQIWHGDLLTLDLFDLEYREEKVYFSNGEIDHIFPTWLNRSNLGVNCPSVVFVLASSKENGQDEAYKKQDSHGNQNDQQSLGYSLLFELHP